MEFQEYPKALYKGGDQSAEHVIVHDAKEETTKREAGYHMLGDTAPAPAQSPVAAPAGEQPQPKAKGKGKTAQQGEASAPAGEQPQGEQASA